MPSSYAKKAWQQTQENNLIYVAITRAKQYLGYITSNEWKDEPNLVLPAKPVSVAQPAKVAQKAGKTKVAMKGFNPFTGS